jgi:uncharacterized glyoxalase superfamily protein PhnB
VPQVEGAEDSEELRTKLTRMSQLHVGTTDFIGVARNSPDYEWVERAGFGRLLCGSLYVNVDDVDKHSERARRAGAKIIEEPKDTFYGARRYGAEDPEGHQWYFAEEIPKRRPRKRSRKS